MKRITILLVDDSAIVRQSFRSLLKKEVDFELLGEAKNGRQAIAKVKKLRPQVVLMDFAMPVLNGAQATRRILEEFPATRVLMLSVHSEKEYIAEAIKAGSAGYLFKITAAECLSHAIRQVQKGKTYFSRLVGNRSFAGKSFLAP